MTDPKGRLGLRIAGGILLLGGVETLCGLFGFYLQKGPSNFGCFFVIFTTPIGIAVGTAVAVFAEKRHMTNSQFVLLLLIVTVATAAGTLLYVATRP